jgi:hypothetical protein
MATKQKQTYTVRIEWDARYYCDTTVEASSPDEAKRLALENPDYDNQESYDGSMDSESEVEGVCLGDTFEYDNQLVCNGGDA